jgi:hypothetical protein
MAGGTAWARHAMCESALSVNVTALRQRIGVGVPLCAAGRSTLQLCFPLRRCTAIRTETVQYN